MVISCAAPTPASIWEDAELSGKLDVVVSSRYVPDMTIIALTVPDDLSAALHVPVEALASELAFAASVRLYQEGRLSLSKAAEIAATDRFTFASRLAELGIATAAFDPADVEAARTAAIP